MRLWPLICVVCAVSAVIFGAGCGKSENEKAQAKKSAPAKDDGGGYIDVLRQTRRDAKELAAIEPVRQCVQAFQALKGRNPKDLAELKKEFSELPDPPAGEQYEYDPATGEVNLVAVTKP